LIGEGNIMKKIFGILVCILLITTTLSATVMAGNEENPELVDELDDTDLDKLDINSVWFYEKSDEPEYLYIAMKIKNLNEKINAIFSVTWFYNGIKYVSGLDTFFYKEKVFRSSVYQRATHQQWKTMPECESIFDIDTNIITWKILKVNIGNPQRDSVLTKTRASAVLGFPSSFLLFLSVDYRDFAPNNITDYGKDYTIKY